MATHQDVGADPSSENRSFLEALASTHPDPSTSAPQPQPSMHKGEPAIIFPLSSVARYSTPYKYAMIGKFSQGRPSMDIIRNFFVSQDFKLPFSVGLLDSRHIILNLQGEADFHRVYSRSIWYIAGKSMRVFKWTPNFHVDRESSVVPLWIRLPKIPVQFFNKEALFGIAKLFGQPLRLDSATTEFKRPSVARLQVEIDLLKSIPARVWIQMEGSIGFWQKIEPDEDIPSYCPHCWHVGHTEQFCHVKHPELKVLQKNTQKVDGPIKQYKPKQPNNVVVVSSAEPLQLVVVVGQPSFSSDQVNQLVLPKESLSDAHEPAPKSPASKICAPQPENNSGDHVNELVSSKENSPATTAIVLQTLTRRNFGGSFE